MSDVSTLLAEFVDAARAGGAPEVKAFLERAESGDARRELAEAIETVLALGGSDFRWRRDPISGELDDPAVSARAETLVEKAFADQTHVAQTPFARLRERSGLTIAALANELLSRSGLAESERTRTGFRSWVAALDRGLRGLDELSERARTAIADSLAVATDELSDLEQTSGAAFRATENDELRPTLEALESAADEMAEELEDADSTPLEDGEVNRWFTGGD